jgi:hypothetical protein
VTSAKGICIAAGDYNEDGQERLLTISHLNEMIQERTYDGFIAGKAS